MPAELNGCGGVLFLVLTAVPTLEKEVVRSRPRREVVVCIQIASCTGVESPPDYPLWCLDSRYPLS